jgi:uncharacterized Tic20 family protein
MPEYKHRWDNSEMQPPIPNPQSPFSRQSVTSLTAEERNWAMGCHLAAFSGYMGIPFGHVLGPLLVWVIKRDTSAFINEHGKEALNYNISISIYFTVCVFLFFTIVGIPLAIMGGITLAIADVILRIIAALKASNGEHYSYPMTIRFLN